MCLELPARSHHRVLVKERKAQSHRATLALELSAEKDFLTRIDILIESANSLKRVGAAENERASCPFKQSERLDENEGQHPRCEVAGIHPQCAAASDNSPRGDRFGQFAKRDRRNNRVCVNKQQPVPASRFRPCIPRPGNLVVRFEDDFRAKIARYLRRCVCGVVVANDDLAEFNSILICLEGRLQGTDSRSEVIGFVKRRNDNGQTHHRIVDVSESDSHFSCVNSPFVAGPEPGPIPVQCNRNDHDGLVGQAGSGKLFDRISRCEDFSRGPVV
jgi:hypothetical protein